MQWCIKLYKSYNKDIYSIPKDFYLNVKKEV